jgi:hypothetical protein
MDIAVDVFDFICKLYRAYTCELDGHRPPCHVEFFQTLLYEVGELPTSVGPSEIKSPARRCTSHRGHTPPPTALDPAAQLSEMEVGEGLELRTIVLCKRMRVALMFYLRRSVSFLDPSVESIRCNPGIGVLQPRIPQIRRGALFWVGRRIPRDRRA